MSNTLQLFDEGFDAAAREGYVAKPARLGVGAVLALVAGTGLGWKVMALWFTAILIAEGGSWLANKRSPYPEKASSARRYGFMTYMMAVGMLWLTPSVLMWISGSPALQVAAAAQWVANIMYVQLFARKSRLYAALSMAPLVICSLIGTIFMSPFHGVEAIAPVSIILMATFNGVLAMVTGLEHHEKMVRAVRERDESAVRLSTTLEASRRSEHRLRLAAAMAKMRVVEVNNRTGEIVTYAPDFGVWKQGPVPSWTNVHPDDLPETLRLWERHETLGEPFNAVFRVIREDGSCSWLQTAAEAVGERDADGRAEWVVVATRDIDQEKQIEMDLMAARDAAQRASVAKSTFLATMSHEIRTPLNGVIGMAQVMAGDILTPVQRERLTVLQQSSETLMHLLNDLLDLSKIEAGKLELEVADFDLGMVATAAHATFKANAEAKGIRFELDIAPDARGVYRATRPGCSRCSPTFWATR